MVLKFRLISDEKDDFVRDFEILAEQSFFILHMAIQDNLHFDKSQIASFFTCTPNWEKNQEITLFELSEEQGARVITMENAMIGDHMQNLHDKMFYIFDVFNERLLFIELVSIHEEDPSKKYPYCSSEKGQAPQQLIMDPLFDLQDLSNGIILSNLPGQDEFLDYDTEAIEDIPDNEIPDE
jgi:hypothetical protein